MGFRYLVRDQEVDGSNPFAPTTPKILPFISLRHFLRFGCFGVLWTIVDQLKAQSDTLGPLLAERNVLFELGVEASHPPLSAVGRLRHARGGERRFSTPRGLDLRPAARLRDLPPR
jgi:hypothetical protein